MAKKLSSFEEKEVSFRNAYIVAGVTLKERECLYAYKAAL